MKNNPIQNLREYKTWRAMKYRGKDTKKAHLNTAVCPEWEASFMTFWKDMGNQPPGSRLVREDTSLPYSKSNCFWLTGGSGAQRKQSAATVTHNGFTGTLAEWSVKLGVPEITLRSRISAGWAISDVLSPGRTTKYARGHKAPSGAEHYRSKAKKSVA
jgi:hypothetical protein